MLAALGLMIAADGVGIRLRLAYGKEIAEGNRVVEAIQKLLLDCQEAESSQRGYLLTLEPGYLQAYHEGVGLVQADEALLLRALQAHPEPVGGAFLERVRPQIDAKLEELARTVALAQAGGVAGARAMVMTHAGEGFMSHLRGELQQAVDVEGRQLAELDRRAARVNLGSDLLFAFAALGAMALLLVSEHRRMKSRVAAEVEARRFQRFSQVAEEGVVVLRKGRIVDANPAYQRMFGYSLEELRELRLMDLVASEWREGVQFRHATHTEGTYEVPCLRKDGTRFQVLATSHEEALPDEAERTSIVRDLTTLRAWDAERRQLLAILDATPDFIAVQRLGRSREDPDRITYWNQAMHRLQGVPIGAPLEAGVWMGESAYLDAEGQMVPVHQQVIALRDEAGTPTHVATLARDISEQKVLERAKRDFVAMSNHELRTPITSLIGSLRLLEHGLGGALEAGARGLLQIALANADRLLKLVNDLLDLDKLEAGAMEFQHQDLVVADLLEEACRTHQHYAERRGVRFELGPLPEGLRVEADGHRVLQVLSNLMSNAAKFSPQGAVVRLRAQRVPDGVRVEVEDRGPGIPEAFRDRVFQKFEQAESTRQSHPGGTGLGLSLSRLLVTWMGGSFGSRSEEGRGTTFFFTLPAPGTKVGAS